MTLHTPVVPNLVNISPAPPYLKFFIVFFLFTTIATKQTQVVKKLNYVMCSVNRNTAVVI